MKSHHTIAPGKALRAMFPEQTKSTPAILIWLVIFLLDVALVFWLAGKLGIHILDMNYSLRSTMVLVYVAVAGAVFWVESFIYNRIVSLFR